MFWPEAFISLAIIVGPILAMLLADARNDLRRYFAGRSERGRG